jgi:predicted nucleic acid-binding protein
MHKIVVSDTSCLIILEKIGQLTILQNIYSEIVTTPEVEFEFGSKLPAWIKVIAANNRTRQNELNRRIDLGESSAIALAFEIENSLLLVDDLKARKVAEEMGLSFTGTLGVLVKAKQMGIVSSVRSMLEELHKHDFRFSAEVEQDILLQSNE